jgi:hypothetical protein
MCSGNATFCVTVMFGKESIALEHHAEAALVRWNMVGSACHRRESRRCRASGIPPAKLSSVVLPLPDGPSRRNELAGFDVETDAIDRDEVTRNSSTASRMAMLDPIRLPLPKAPALR